MVNVKVMEFCGWKNCIQITNGSIEVIVTTDVGPRIVSLSMNKKENHLMLFKETLGKSGGDGFIPYGGHRVWHAPEKIVRTYQPDNNKVDYKLIENGVVLTADMEKQTGLVKGMIVTMTDDGEITVTHTLENKSLFDIELSIWGISQFAHGGLMAVPNCSYDSGFVSNRCVSMWPYSKMNDERVYWGDKFITVTPDTKHEKPFKFGSTVADEYAAYFNHNQMVIKKLEFYEAEYPNYSCNFESYTNNDFIEIESLSPLFTLEPNETESFTEKWYVVDNVKCPSNKDEKAIEKAIKDSKIIELH